jgi:hypothetical protein
MNVDEWRKQREQGEDATLPSGLTVQLRQVSMLDLASKGEIPQTLKPQIDALMQGGANISKMTLEGISKFVGVIDLVVGACLAGPDGLKVSELTYQDKLAIFTWANEMGGKLQPFRRQEAESVGA